MSVASDAWEITPPAIRDFYVNYHRRYLAHGWKAGYFVPGKFWFPFSGLGWSFQGYSGYALFQANITAQQFPLGFFDVAKVQLETDPDYPPPSIQPAGPFPWLGAYPDQFIEIPDVASQYPRAKYKVRRSYWTGKPKRRRNL